LDDLNRLFIPARLLLQKKLFQFPGIDVPGIFLLLYSQSCSRSCAMACDQACANDPCVFNKLTFKAEATACYQKVFSFSGRSERYGICQRGRSFTDIFFPL